MYLKDIHSISFYRCSNMFNIRLHLFCVCLVLSFYKIESRNVLKKSKPVYETSGAKVVKTGSITKWLRQKAMKSLLLASLMLLPKPQVQIVKANEETFKKPNDLDTEWYASRG